MYFLRLLHVLENPGLPTVEAPNSVIGEVILPAVFGIIGVVSVLFIILGGLRYVISAGKPEQVKKAKDSILYAAVGLVVSILAITIVNFVVSSLN